MVQTCILVDSSMLSISSFRLRPFEPVQGICLTGSCKRHGGGIRIRYAVQDRGNRISFPAWKPVMQRLDLLWEHTCFELFVRGAGQEEYQEYNFSPANAWSAFGFERYRHNRADADVAVPPLIRVARSGDHFTLEAIVPELDLNGCQIGISAVLETVDAGRSFWALSHPSDKPDFHDARSWK